MMSYIDPWGYYGYETHWWANKYNNGKWYSKPFYWVMGVASAVKPDVVGYGLNFKISIIKSFSLGYQENYFLNSNDKGTYFLTGLGRGLHELSAGAHFNIGWSDQYNPNSDDYLGFFDEYSLSTKAFSGTLWKDDNWIGASFSEGIEPSVGFSYEEVLYEKKPKNCYSNKNN